MALQVKQPAPTTRAERHRERVAVAARMNRDGPIAAKAATRVLAVGACLMLAMPVTRAHSQPTAGTANSVMPGCDAFLASKSPGNNFLQGVCAGEVLAAWDIAVVVGSVCSPSDAVLSQLVRVIAQYIYARPARMHERFAVLAVEAMRAAWPCK